MADAEKDIYHLHRYYRAHRPQFRWACSLERDESADHGFRVVEFDAKVADSSFWAELATFMDQPVWTRWAGESDDPNMDVMMSGVVTADDPKHFGAAIRKFPLTRVCPTGRGGVA